MRKYYYDLHIHSCLSPCADNDNTPNNIAGMASLCKLDIVALTDHNTAKNCPAFFKAAQRYGIIPVAGMELTTSEDIHVVCLFEALEDAMAFDEEITAKRIPVKNRTDIFGEQLILDGEDNVIACEENLLSNATSVSLDEAPAIVGKYRGVCYPAHIDREANGIIATLGTFPKTPAFSAAEFHNREKIQEYIKKYGLEDKSIIISSDAHCLTDIRDRENFLELDDRLTGSFDVSKRLIEALR